MSILIGVFCGLIAMLGWGIGEFLMKEPSKRIGEIEIFFYMQFIGAIITIPIFINYIKNNTIILNFLDIFLIIIIGAVDVVAFLSFLKGINTGELSIVSPISSVYSIITVILSVIFLNEILKINQIIAILLALSGVVLTSTDLKNIHKIHSVKGVNNAIISMILWGIYLFLTGILVTRIQWIPTFIMTTVGTVSFATIAFIFKKNKKKPRKKDYKTFFIISTLSTIAWLAMNYAFSKKLVSVASVVSSLSPLITILLASYFLKEKLYENQEIGISLILTGLILISL